jgi:hypothetical protein
MLPTHLTGPTASQSLGIFPESFNEGLKTSSNEEEGKTEGGSQGKDSRVPATHSQKNKVTTF